jgi:hypothetical protein
MALNLRPQKLHLLQILRHLQMLRLLQKLRLLQMQILRLLQHRGRKVMIVWWSGWQTYCRAMQ